MLTNDNVADIMKAVKGEGYEVTGQDFTFLVLCDTYEDKHLAYKAVFGVESDDVNNILRSDKFRALARAAKPFGVGVKDNMTITSEENMNALVKMLNQIEDLQDGKTPDPDLIKLAADIRFKVQAKFDLQQDADEGKHIIVVPQKHDMICPHTNRECTQMPSKEACCEYYNLREDD